MVVSLWTGGGATFDLVSLLSAQKNCFRQSSSQIGNVFMFLYIFLAVIIQNTSDNKVLYVIGTITVALVLVLAWKVELNMFDGLFQRSFCRKTN